MADLPISALPLLLGALKDDAIIPATQDGMTQGIEAQKILEYIGGNLSPIMLNAVSGNINLRITNTGNVEYRPAGQPEILANRVSVGVYELTAPAGTRWFTGHATGMSATAIRPMNVNISGTPGSNVCTVYARNESGNLADYNFSFTGFIELL